MRVLAACLLLAATTRLALAQDVEPARIASVPADIVEDQKQIWSFPFKLTRGSHWISVAGFVSATALLVELDPHDTPYFRRTTTFANFNKVLSSGNTAWGEGLFPAGFYLVSLLRKDSAAEKTGLLAMESLADAEGLSEVFKNVARRKTPLEIAPFGDFSDTWFKASSGFLVNRGSFISGHATGAFAVATVFAERYRRRRWVPVAAYSLAGLIAFSRVSTQNHFPSDVFAGAVICYSTSHFVVLQRHR